VVLESTVYPGATEQVVGPALAAVSGLRCGVDFCLGYSPEPINPGDRQHTVERLTKVVAGQTEAVTERLAAMYRRITGGLGHEPQIILTGRAVNDAMPGFIADRLAAQLSPGGSILMLGLTFKENVPDLRNSKAAELALELRARGFDLTPHDPLADLAEAGALYGLTPLAVLPEGQVFDVVLGVVPHRAYARLDGTRLLALLRPGGLLADLKGMWRERQLPDGIRRWVL
jgi:UDP-N-acetyl-D-galactosamine dehydrogenase